MEKNRDWSFSRLNAYSWCPYKYYWGYEMGVELPRSFPLNVGSFFHEMVAAYNKGGLQCTVAMHQTILDRITAIGDPDRERKAKDALKRASKALNAYERFSTPLDIIAVELDVSRTLRRWRWVTISQRNYESVGFHGIVDALCVHEGNLWTVEYKTGKPNMEFETLHNWQAPFYAWLTGAHGTIFELINTSVKNIKEHHISREFMEWTEVEKQSVVDNALNIAYNIEHSKKTMRRSRDCLWCPYKLRCLSQIQGA